MAGADSVEKLEDVIVRSAEQVAGQMRAAGADVVLVGEALVTNKDPRTAIGDLIAAADSQDAR